MKKFLRYRTKENAFGRFVITHPNNDQLGWTGSAWARIDEYGLPIGKAQVSNFATEAEARECAEEQLK